LDCSLTNKILPVNNPPFQSAHFTETLFFRYVEIKPGTRILTDGWSGYNELNKNDFIHKKVILAKSGDPAHVLMPGVHRIASLLKRWLLGTHQGAVKGKHLDYYLDEYTFRFNRRKSSSRGMLFYRLMQQAVMIETVPYYRIVNNDHNI